jgi:glycosyltransferase involved in cell wall biosynthesis
MSGSTPSPKSVLPGKAISWWFAEKDEGMSNLAVVIPAYKIKFLHKALGSLAAQTNKNFTVYVGDDASKEDILSVCERFGTRLDIRYHRFPDNLGGSDLVGQWNRCSGLIEDEAWLWLFSDDDIAEPGCVETFYNTLQKTTEYYDVYRFDTVTIDRDDTVVAVSPESPETEDRFSLAYHLLQGQRGNSMPDHIFRAARVKENGGFVNFPFGQASDYASSIRFADPRGLYTMRGPKVRWRYSGDNISSVASSIRSHAIFGYLAFIRWIVRELNIGPAGRQNEGHVRLSTDLVVRNLSSTIASHYKGIPADKFQEVVKEVGGIFQWGYLRSLWYCTRINSGLYMKNRKRIFSSRFRSVFRKTRTVPKTIINIHGEIDS